MKAEEPVRSAFFLPSWDGLLARVAALAVILLIAASPSFIAGASAQDALEMRARALFRELRCMVCDNQSIDESNAVVAGEMRAHIRDALRQGKSKGEIREFMQQRYGDIILLQPRFVGHNLLLWLSGPIIVLLGGLGVFRYFRARASDGQ